MSNAVVVVLLGWLVISDGCLHVVLTDTEGCITTNLEFRAFTQRVVVENTLLLLHHVRNNPVDITKHRFV